MNFRVLGPLEVVDGDVPLPLGKGRERVLLLALLLHRNERLSRERLVDLIWGETPPRTVNASLHNAVSQLRRLLGPERLVGGDGAYRIVVGEGELDRDRFESLVADGQAALAEGNPERAAGLLSDALALWRGDPFEDVRYESFAQTEIRRLVELRLTALEARVEADLARGRHGTLVPELEGLVRAHPWRERLRVQLMLALYRCGRQADALEAYQAARAALADELGLEPAAELQELERRILVHDPTLELAETDAPAVPPIPPTPLIGRERELAGLRALLSEENGSRVLTLVGPGGVGKTRLALELAALSPLRVVFADLSPLSTADQVLPTIAHALGVRETGGRSLAAATAARVRALGECLLVVDNWERVLEAATELAALLASCPGLRVLATSRAPLHIAGEREYSVEPLDEETAAALFVERARSLRASFAHDEAVAALCRRLDCLPLAVELAAARTNVLSTKQILARLDDRFELFTGGPRDAPARQQTLRAVLDWSYQLLTEEEKLLFTRLAVFASAFSLDAAEAVCGASLDTLSALVEKSLVQQRGGRFVLLETIRAYARELFERSGQQDDLRRKQAEYLVSSCKELKFPAIVALVDAEPEDFRSCLAWALDTAPDLALPLAVAVSFYTLRTGQISGRPVAEGRRWIHEALEATPDEPSRARTFALGTASDLARGAGNAEDAKRFAESAVEAARLLDDPYLLGGALNGLAAAVHMLGAHDVAERIGEEALDAARASGDAELIGAVTSNLGIAACARGDWDRALRLFGAHLAVAEGKPYENFVLIHLTLAELQLGHDPGAVAARYMQIYQRASEDQQPYLVVCALHGLGLTAAKAGQSRAAVRVLAAALSAYERQGLVLDVPERIVRIVHEETVESLRTQLGADPFAAAWDEGRTLSPDAAATLALESIHAAAPARSLPLR